jgi:hypothetical protein
MTSDGCSENLYLSSMRRAAGGDLPSWGRRDRAVLRRAAGYAEDIALLYRQVGYHTLEEGLALVERSYPERPIAPREQFLLEEIVQSLDA